MQYIESAPAEGAQLVIGRPASAAGDSGGYFVEPTVFRDVSPSARIAQEEIFGPVLSVIPFEDEAEAIRIANGTMYGLAAMCGRPIFDRHEDGEGDPLLGVINAAAPMGEGAGSCVSSSRGPIGHGHRRRAGGHGELPAPPTVWFNHA